MLKELIPEDWQVVLQDEFNKPYFLKLEKFLLDEWGNHTIYPVKNDVFNALRLTSFAKVKVVVIGQDPYHGAGQAHGLAFSVKHGIKQPPSLKNIFKERETDLGVPIPSHGYLVEWAEQGCLLINTVLTVRAGQANSHKKMGWEKFTDAIFQALAKRDKRIVYLLWGSHAQKKKRLITNPNHAIITGVHPSPLSSYRGFFGSKPFSNINKLLKEDGLQAIDWSLRELQPELPLFGTTD